MKKNNFTILELLVVVAIIAILLSILLPSLRSARQTTMQAVCLSNLKNQGVGFTTHAANMNGRFPIGGGMGTTALRRNASSNALKWGQHMNKILSYPGALDAFMGGAIRRNNFTVLRNDYNSKNKMAIFLCPSDAEVNYVYTLNPSTSPRALLSYLANENLLGYFNNGKVYTVERPADVFITGDGVRGRWGYFYGSGPNTSLFDAYTGRRGNGALSANLFDLGRHPNQSMSLLFVDGSARIARIANGALTNVGFSSYIKR